MAVRDALRPEPRLELAAPPPADELWVSIPTGPAPACAAAPCVSAQSRGYGLYSFLLTALAGAASISFVALMYGSSIIVPASACELGTTSAQQGLMVAVPVAGAMAGSLLWGFLGDTRGRRSMLLVSLVLAATSNALASLSVHWVMLMLVQLLTVTLGSGLYLLSMILLSESVPLRKRNVVTLLVSSAFLLGQGIMSVMAIPIIPLTFSYYLPALGIYWNSWRTMQVVYSLPSLLCAAWLLFMQESPKYALASGDEDRALRILRKIHRTNNGFRGEELQVKGLLRETGSTEKKSAKDKILPLFMKPHLKNTLIMACLYILFQIIVAFMVWAPTIANQFMQLLETGQGSDLTLCQIINSDIGEDSDVVPCSINGTAMGLLMAMCGLHAVFNTVLSQIVDKTGRRNMAMAVVCVCGAAGLLINLVPNAIGSAVLFLLMSLAVVMMGLYTAIAVAVFPTHMRSMAVATTMMGAGLASMGFIQLVNYLLVESCGLAFYILISLFISSALVLALLPDDRCRPAPRAQASEALEGTEQRSPL